MLKYLAMSALAAGALYLPLAQAAQFPEKPVRVVVGYSAGGPTDTIVRIVSDELAKKWGVPVIVENKPGATSTIATGYVAAAEPDGHTLVALANDFVASRFVYPELRYDAKKDIALIGMLAITPNVLVVSKDAAHSNYSDFATALKQSGDSWVYSSTGVASTSHLAVERYKQVTGFQANHVPYKGFAPSLPDLMTGRIDFAIPSLSSVRTHIEAGALVPLAVVGSERSQFLPDTPTFEEAGVKDFNIQTWYALAAPSGVSDEIREQINRDLNSVLSSEEVAEKIRNQGTDIALMSVEEIEAFVEADVKTVESLIKTLDIDLN